MENISIAKAGFETREIGILVYDAADYRLGINLCKVREITRMLPLKPVPYSHHAIQGVFELRDRLVPAINLRTWLQADNKYPDSAKIILAEFLGLRVGFLVDGVDGIHRLRWQDIEPPERIKRFSREILGTVKLDGQIINMIDYEHIVLAINPDIIPHQAREKKKSRGLIEKRKTRSIWIVEDSNTVRDFLKNYLKEHAYTNIVFFENGKHALDTLSVLKRKKQLKKDETERVDVIITDIEMPVMDGYTFVKTLKEDEFLKTIPVILFSSFISPENKLKGEIVDADAQLSKADSSSLVHLMDRFIFR
jgi:two-component system chemotaxis response regulator CheV